MRRVLLGSAAEAAAAKAEQEDRAWIPPKLRQQFLNAPLMKMCLLHLLYLFACGTGDNNNALLFFQLSCVSAGHNATACAEHTLTEAQRAAVSAEASSVLRMWTFGQCSVAMFSVPFWSRLSDRYGRRFGLMLPPFALMINYLSAALFAESTITLPDSWVAEVEGWQRADGTPTVVNGPEILTIIAVVGGLIGPNYLYWACAFCVNGDVTAPDDRMYSFPLQQGAAFVGIALSPLITGATVDLVKKSSLVGVRENAEFCIKNE